MVRENLGLQSSKMPHIEGFNQHVSQHLHHGWRKFWTSVIIYIFLNILSMVGESFQYPLFEMPHIGGIYLYYVKYFHHGWGKFRIFFR